tara:strand:- start:869 stop:1654 length:786 start_codon:yes stop_codon:yes gene_type:complete
VAINNKIELAKLLADLRRTNRQQSGLHKKLTPISQADAYKVAHLVEKELGWNVGGWKIAATNRQMQRALRTNTPIYGRVYSQFITKSPVEISFDNLCSPIPEPEYQVFLGKDLPPRSKPYEIGEVADSIKSMHPGLELAECRFIHDNKFPPLEAILADGAGSGTLVYGPAIQGWKDKDIANNEVALFCNGVFKRKGTAVTAMEHPLIPATWLANELSKTGIGLKKGQVISTGTLTGMLIPKKGETYTADFGIFGSVSGTYK